MAQGEFTDIRSHIDRRSGNLLALIVIAGAFGAGPAAAGNADSGRVLAEKWCTGCHLIGNSSPGSDVAPPFVGIAADAEKSRGGLEAWLATPHTAMPAMPLTRRDIDDLVTYIESLAP